MHESTTVTVGLDVHARSIRVAAVRADEYWRSGRCLTTRRRSSGCCAAGRRSRRPPRPSRPPPRHWARAPAARTPRPPARPARAGARARSGAPAAPTPRHRARRRAAARPAAPCAAVCAAPPDRRAATRRSAADTGPASAPAVAPEPSAAAAAKRAPAAPPADEHRGGGPARGSTNPPAADPYGSARTAPPSIPSPLRPPARAPKGPNGRVAVGRGWGQIKRPKWGQVRRPKRIGGHPPGKGRNASPVVARVAGKPLMCRPPGPIVQNREQLAGKLTEALGKVRCELVTTGLFGERAANGGNACRDSTSFGSLVRAQYRP
jgi:hypothetical protein